MRILNRIHTEAIREIVFRGKNDELLNYLEELVKSNEKSDGIAFAVLEAFSDLQPEDWNVDHLTKLKEFSKFSTNELKVDIEPLFYIYDAILFNCLIICKNFYSATLTDQFARERLEFVRSARLIFNEEFKIDSVVSYGLNSVDKNFERILNGISELNKKGSCQVSPTEKYHIAFFDYIHSLIFGCHFRLERMSPKTYDALVWLLNLFYENFSSRHFGHSSEVFRGFCLQYGFYIGGEDSVSRQTELSDNFQRRFIASEVLHGIGLYCPDFTAQFGKLENRKWLTTRQSYDSIKVLFEAKSRKGNPDEIRKRLESYLNKFQFKDRKGTVELCYLFYQHNQFTYDVFCQVFCNELELREGARFLWDQLNLKIFRDNPDKIKLFSQEEIYGAAFLESPHLAPSDESGSRAQQLVKLMLRCHFQWGVVNRASASEILLALWHDAKLKLNYPSTEMIFLPGCDINKIFQYYSYLLLMRLLNDEDNPSKVNPVLIGSFLSDDWQKWGRALYNLMKFESTQVIREFFSIQNETDFHAQLEKLKSPVLLSNGSESNADVDGSREDCWVSVDWNLRDIDLLRPLNIGWLKKIIRTRNELESLNEQTQVLSQKGMYFPDMLPLTVRLVQNHNFSCSAIGHFILTHVESRGWGDTGAYRKTDFIDNAEAEFKTRFVNITDAKNVLMHLVAWSANQDSPNKKLPRDIMFKIAFYFLPGDYSSALRACFFNLISREFFIRELKSAKLGDAHCYAAIRECYPITEDPEDYKNSIEELISQNIFTKENVEKLQAESEKTSLAGCKLIHK